MKNRRKDPRIPLVTMARISPHGLQNTADGLVRDLSTHGMGVYVKWPYQKGDLLLVKISLKTDDGTTINASLVGLAVWAASIQEGRYAVGIEFTDLQGKSPELYAYLKRLEKLQDEKGRPDTNEGR